MKIKILFILLVVSAAATGYAQDLKESTGSGVTGPRLHMNYHPENTQSNSVDCFMYFIPLTSPTSVMVDSSPGTTLSANITSWKTTQQGKTVRVQCNFEISGDGNYSASYNPREMIESQLAKKKNPSEVTKLLECIRIDGPCKGRIRGLGKVVNGKVQMKEVEVSFNRNNSQSSVEISMYDIPKVNSKFLYENRKNGQVARVNALKFKQDKNGISLMSVEIASLKKAEEKHGLFSKLTAMIANILLTSTPVSPVGGSTMMDFSTALYQKKPVFVFPHASNIKSQEMSKL